jgi:molybdopterin-guanine dinucleotide biosynthesis protein A
MQPRTVFDVVLVVLVTGTLAFELATVSSSEGNGGSLDGITTAVQNIDTVYFLVLGGILGVVFVSYIAIYLPHKHSQSAER